MAQGILEHISTELKALNIITSNREFCEGWLAKDAGPGSEQRLLTLYAAFYANVHVKGNWIIQCLIIEGQTSQLYANCLILRRR